MEELNESRNVDLVLCIDGTGSMGECIDVVKENALSFKDQLYVKMSGNWKVAMLRVKVIVFRDYGFDENPMEISPFFELPTDDADFKNYIDGINAEGGGDNEENGFEALYYAMMSDFVDAKKGRQIIVLFTDADALPLGERKSLPARSNLRENKYPEDMVSKDELDTIWACASQNGCKLRPKQKRLVIFAPDDTAYKNDLVYDQCYYQATELKGGLKEIDFEDILNLIVASIK